MVQHRTRVGEENDVPKWMFNTIINESYCPSPGHKLVSSEQIYERTLYYHNYGNNYSLKSNYEDT